MGGGANGRSQFREGSVTPVATGSLAVTIGAQAATSDSTGQKATTQSELAGLVGARHPVMGVWANISTGHSVDGSHVIGTDDVQSAPLAPPFAAGTFNWPIPVAVSRHRESERKGLLYRDAQRSRECRRAYDNQQGGMFRLAQCGGSVMDEIASGPRPAGSTRVVHLTNSIQSMSTPTSPRRPTLRYAHRASMTGG